MARRFALLFAIVPALFALSCGDDTSSSNKRANNAVNNATNNSTNNDSKCSDADGDGYSVGLECEGIWDCDDSNPNANPGLEESCFDSADNNCDGAVDEGCPNCPEGATVQCGGDVGACEFGAQTCRDGVWSGCEGGVTSTLESCNGLDDDCDGEIDEQPEKICQDGLKCNGSEVCVDAVCNPGTPVDCGAMGAACAVGLLREGWSMSPDDHC